MLRGRNLTLIYRDGHTTVDAFKDASIRVEDDHEADQIITLSTGQEAGGNGRLVSLARGNAPTRGAS